MKSFVTAAQSDTSLSTSRRSVVRLLGTAPAALLLAASVLTLAPAPARANTNDPATHLSIVVASYLPSPVAGVAYESLLLIAASSTDGNDECFDDNVHFTYTDSSTATPADHQFTNGGLCTSLGAWGGDLGEYWIQFVPKQSGPQTITASDLTRPSMVTSTSVTIDVAPAPATHLAVSGPTNAVTGAGATITVSAMDQWNNVDTNYTGSIDFNSTDKDATFDGVAQPADYTFDSGDNGTRQFIADFAHGGTQTTTVTDYYHPSITGNTVTNVTAAPHFDINDQIQDDATAGVYTSCSVRAMNADGTPDPTYTGTVQFTSWDSSAVLPYDANDVPGQVTLTGGYWVCGGFDLMFHHAGVQSLTATDIHNSSITGSGSVDVSGGDSATVAIVDFPTETFASPVPFTVKMRDVYGNWGSDGHVSVTSSDPKAVLPADYTFHPSSYGKHDFTITLETPGPQTVTVSGYEAGNNFSDTVSTTVLHGSATQLRVSGIANPYTAGSAHGFTVTALDAYGNLDSDYTGTVHFTTSDSKASVPANYTFTGVDTGAHTFSSALSPALILKTAGTQSVTATDTVTASIKGSQTGIVVNAAAVSKLAVSGLTTPRTAGAAGSIRVTATDAYGNRNHGYTGTVKFTSSDTKAVLPANYTFTAADAGTHVFSGAAILKTAGTQSVTATDSVSATIAGAQTVTVTPGAAKTLSVGTFNPFPAGSSHSVTVKAYDAYGNIATGYAGTVTFTCSDTKAKLPADYTFTAADKGVHSFSLGLVLKTAGSQWVRATDKTTGSITGSQTVTVTPGAAKTLTVGTFNPYASGATHSVTVKAYDAYGNVATGYLGTIHFTSSDTKATLPADYTFTAADKGVHSFSMALVLKTVGSQWVRATDKTTASITGAQTVTVT